MDLNKYITENLDSIIHDHNLTTKHVHFNTNNSIEENIIKEFSEETRHVFFERNFC